MLSGVVKWRYTNLLRLWLCEWSGQMGPAKSAACEPGQQQTVNHTVKSEIWRQAAFPPQGGRHGTVADCNHLRNEKLQSQTDMISNYIPWSHTRTKINWKNNENTHPQPCPYYWGRLQPVLPMVFPCKPSGLLQLIDWARFNVPPNT